jgi:hypothetical protein
MSANSQHRRGYIRLGALAVALFAGSAFAADRNRGLSAAAAATPAVAALPDLVSDGAITVGKQVTQWGATVKVDAADARRMHHGRCEFPVRHLTRNAGGGAAAPSMRRWTNDRLPGQWDIDAPPIAAQGAVERVDTLGLVPGRNLLHLKLDPAHALKESNASNNVRRVAVELSGDCGVSAVTRTALPSRW